MSVINNPCFRLNMLTFANNDIAKILNHRINSPNGKTIVFNLIANVMNTNIIAVSTINNINIGDTDNLLLYRIPIPTMPCHIAKPIKSVYSKA